MPREGDDLDRIAEPPPHDDHVRPGPGRSCFSLRSAWTARVLDPRRMPVMPFDHCLGTKGAKGLPQPDPHARRTRDHVDRPRIGILTLPYIADIEALMHVATVKTDQALPI